VIDLSVLDLAPIPLGSDATAALKHSLALAQHAEQLGYRRFWLAEHHGMPGIASAATSVVMAHIAAGTSSIRVGAGGIMLPNHSPLVIAEQFGTLAALHPGRIDLGLGRAPGTDPHTARALRRALTSDVDAFPRDVLELMHYFSPDEGARVRAIPGEGQDVPVWILGSSLFGGQLAAALGLPFAFASHFAPAQMEEAIAVYRHRFRPSEALAKPHLMLAVNVFCADTQGEAALLSTSIQQAFVQLRSGKPTQLPPPVEGYMATLGPAESAMLSQLMTCTFIGTPDDVGPALHAFAKKHGADELIVTSQIFDGAKRLRSYELTMNAYRRAG